MMLSTLFFIKLLQILVLRRLNENIRRFVYKLN